MSRTKTPSEMFQIKFYVATNKKQNVWWKSIAVIWAILKTLDSKFNILRLIAIISKKISCQFYQEMALSKEKCSHLHDLLKDLHHHRNANILRLAAKSSQVVILINEQRWPNSKSRITDDSKKPLCEQNQEVDHGPREQ